MIAACAAARAAFVALLDAADGDAEPDLVDNAIERERKAVEAVAAIRTMSARGVATKAALLADFVSITDGSEPTPELVCVAWSIAEDALAPVKAMVGSGPAVA